MFSKSIDTILLKETTGSYENSLSSSLKQKNIPKEIDDYYQNKVKDLSDKIIKNHKEFIEKEKDIFQLAWNSLNYSEGSIEDQYRILSSKYKIYNKNVYGSLKNDIDSVALFFIKTNDDIKFQRNLIQKFIDKKHIDVKYAKFDVEPIAFSTCLLPSAETIIKTGLESDNSNPWFMDSNRVIERMINELELYTKAENLTSEEIVKRYDKYVVDVKKYYKQYMKHHKTLKQELEEYIDKKQKFYESELKKASGKAKQVLLDQLHNLMDKYFFILKIIILHYNVQLKFLFESFKACVRMVQKPYDYILKNYANE